MSGIDKKNSKAPPPDWQPQTNMRPLSASWYSGVSESKLAKLRMEENRQDGPRFLRIAGCIVYRKDDLDEWLNAHVVE